MAWLQDMRLTTVRKADAIPDNSRWYICANSRWYSLVLEEIEEAAESVGRLGVDGGADEVGQLVGVLDRSGHTDGSLQTKKGLLPVFRFRLRK